MCKRDLSWLVSLGLSLLVSGVSYLALSGYLLFSDAMSFTTGDMVEGSKFAAMEKGTVDSLVMWLYPDTFKLIVAGAVFVLSFVILFLLFRKYRDK